MHDSFLDGNVRRERSAYFGHNERPFLSVFVVFLHVVRVGGTEDLDVSDRVRLEFDLEVIVGGEEGVVEIFEQVLLQVLVLRCAEVVEALHVFEHLADVGPELFRNPDDRRVDALLSMLFQVALFGRQGTIAHVSQHNQSVFGRSVGLGDTRQTLEAGFDAVLDGGSSIY